MTSPRYDMVILSLGDPAPKFQARAYPQGLISLDQFLERKNVLLAFYPGDFLPGGGMEMQRFSENLAQFEELGIEVIGVSCDSLASHQEFALELGLRMTLIADEDQTVSTNYGVIIPGRSGPERVLFVIDKGGIINYIFTGMPKMPDLSEYLKRLCLSREPA